MSKVSEGQRLGLELSGCHSLSSAKVSLDPVVYELWAALVFRHGRITQLNS